MTLKTKDVQDYLKRLRKLQQAKVKYYACGEYGGKRKRPHYHLILFNSDIKNIEKAWILNKKLIGNVFIGDVKGESIAYVLDYISKEKIIPMFDADDRKKEFSIMSKGLGINFLTPQMLHWYKADLKNRNYLPYQNLKLPMPKYYKNKIYNEHEKLILSENAKKLDYENREKLEKEHGEHLDAYLAEIHLNMFRKQKLKSEKRWNKELDSTTS